MTKQFEFIDNNGNPYPEWEQKKLGEVATSLDNKRVPLSSGQRASIKGKVPYYGATQIVDYINDYIFDEELVLIGEDGVDFENFQSKPIAQFVQGKSWVNNHAHVFRADIELITPKFLFYSTVHKDVTAFVVGGGRAKLNKSEALKITIPLPSLPEQEKIAELFGALDERIALTADRVRLLKEQKKGYLQQVFNRELVFTDDNGNPYPEWEQKKLGKLVSIATGKKDANAMVENGDYKFFTCSRETYQIDTYTWDCEAILMAGNGNIGEPKYYKGKFDAYQRTYILHDFEGVLPLYLMPVIDAIFPKVVARETQTGSMPYIRLGTLTELPVPLPSLPEQKKIAEFFGALDERIELTENKLSLLQEQKKGYLQGIFG